jgi:hypothetical protein
VEVQPAPAITGTPALSLTVTAVTAAVSVTLFASPGAAVYVSVEPSEETVPAQADGASVSSARTAGSSAIRSGRATPL